MKDEMVERRWECFSDASYYDMWCVRPVRERTFGAGFHVVNQESAERLRDRLESLEAKLEKARETLWKIERNEDAAYSRDLGRQALKELSQ